MLFASPALAFEGMLKASLSSEQGVAAQIRARYSKAGDVRMDIQSKDAEGQPVHATTIMPATGKSYYSIAHDQKAIVELPYSTLAATSKQVTGAGDNANLEIKKLGKEIVSGVETRHVRVIDKDNSAVIDLWLTQKYPADLWTRAFRGRNLGLVEQAGGVPVVFLVEEIQRMPVPPAVFSLPEGYRRVQAPATAQP